MVGHGGSSVGSYLADPTSPIPSDCASIVVTSTLRVKIDIDKLRTIDYISEKLTIDDQNQCRIRHVVTVIKYKSCEIKTCEIIN